jgi:cell fate (sporulation/competence/biofilm development) regulator YmcA (YheA/YmcA/DUF963 family)
MSVKSLFVLLLSVSPILAQTPLIQAQVERDLANQRAELELKEAIALAEKLVRSHPDKALRDLKLRLRDLDLNTQISTSKRKELVALVQTRIAAIERGQANQPKDPVLDPKIFLRKEENKKALAQAEAEAKDVNETLDAIRKDYADRRDAEATKKIAILAKKYSTNPSVIAISGAGELADKLSYARLLAKEQSDRFVLAMQDVSRSALPPKGDIEFPADWKEKTERRRKLMQNDLYGPEEMKILETLEKPVDLKFKSAPFEESVQSLSTMLDLPIYLDKKSLEELAIDLKTPVNILPNVTARTALRGMLQSVGLTFIIKDKVLQVVSVEKARQNYVTRAYDVSDLVRLGGPFNSPVLWGPYLDYQQTVQNANTLIEMITKSIDPLVWQTGGANSATATFHYPSMSIIIRAPSEVHATLGKSLKR